MKISHTILAFVLAVGATACDQPGGDSTEPTDTTAANEEQAVTSDSTDVGETMEVARG